MRLLHLYTFATILTTICLICQADDYERTQFLNAHNEERAQVGVAPLVWNKTLATFAKTFTKKVQATGHYLMSSGTPYGENMAVGYDASYIAQAVQFWVQEKDNYNHETNTCKTGSDCKHYTQVVWRNTKSLGCVTVTIGAGWPFVVCEYYPRGNIKGQSPY